MHSLLSILIEGDLIDTYNLIFYSLKKGRVTIAGKPSKDLTKDILYSILKQAGLNKDILK